MSALARLPFLTRLAGRYAARHRAQTLRAVLGLLVATTVLVTGLGLGESIAVSLERTALARYGPVDATASASSSFPTTLVDRILADPDVRAQGVQGVATLHVTGSVVNPRTGLAEAFATVRGVSSDEAARLGPLPALDSGAAPGEPAGGQVVLCDTLAASIGARVGDTVTLRAPPPRGGPQADIEPVPLVGATGLPSQAQPAQAIEVREGALGLGAEVSFTGVGPVTLEATSPGGFTFANSSDTSPVQLIVPGPLETGTWNLRVTSGTPATYQGGAAVAYVPEDLLGGFVTLEASVSGIAKEEGRAGVTGRPTALVPLGDLQSALGVRGNATHMWFRVQGDPFAAVAAIEEALGPRRDDFDVEADKAEMIANAEEAGAEIAGFLLVMGAFTVVAAVLLAFTLFSALVEERRAELGIARALGLTRGEVAFTMTVEGALYAGIAALAGLAVGVAILAGLLALIGSFAAREGGPEFGMHLSPETLVTSFLVGALLPLITIGLASLRFARLDPARAIRGIPDDPKGKRRLGVGFATLLLVAGAAMLPGEFLRLLGIPLVLGGLATLLAAYARPRLALLAALVGVAHVAWTLYTFDAFPDESGELDPVFTLARGGLLALGLAALAAASPKPYEALGRLLARGRAKRSVFLAARYLVSRRRPAGLTMAMISLVVVIVTVMGTLFVVFGSSIPEQEAGYTVLGESALLLEDFPRALPGDVAPAVERADFLPRHAAIRQATVTREGGDPVEFESGARVFLGVTPGFGDANEYELVDRAPQYATDRDAWRAVARGDAVLFPEWAWEESGLVTGERITLETPGGGARDYVAAGGVRSQFVFQTFVASDHVRGMGFPVTTSVFVRVAEGHDPNVVTGRLNALYAEDGVSFTSIPAEVQRISANIQALVLVFESFLALGLFVGLAATGFLAQRAVRERMRDIGTLRALGMEERDVRNAFLFEATLTAGLGILIGTAVGLLVAHSIWVRNIQEDDIAFRPPVLLMLLFSTAVLGLAAWASSGPAKRAARLPPAIAVRHVE